MRFHHLLAAGCLSFFSLASHAEILTNLYQVREPVSSQSPEERTQATQKALQTLFIRLTGDAKALQNPALEPVRKDPQQIIRQYGYDAGPPESLQVDFDPVSTERALRQAGLSLWGSNRPALLSWWLADSVEGSSLVGDGQMPFGQNLIHASIVEAVCVPSAFTLHTAARHGMETAEDILDSPAHNVMDTGLAIGRGRTLVKDKTPVPGTLLYTPVKYVIFLPEIKDLPVYFR